MLKSDPTAPDDQCEEDDPYVSEHEKLLKQQSKPGAITPSAGGESALQLPKSCGKPSKKSGGSNSSILMQLVSE